MSRPLSREYDEANVVDSPSVVRARAILCVLQRHQEEVLTPDEAQRIESAIHNLAEFVQPDR